MKMTRLIISLLLLSVSFSCAKKKKSDETEEATVEGPFGRRTTGTGSTQTNDEGVLQVSLEGTPDAYSNASSIQITVKSDGGSLYRYQYLENKTDCSIVTFGQWRGLQQPIEESLGDDGQKLLCILVSGNNSTGETAVSSVSYGWIKDTASPAIAFDSMPGIGPHSTAGSSTIISGTTSDSVSGVQSVHVSIESNGSCLTEAMTDFTAPCPQPLNAQLNSNNTWYITLPDSVFQAGASYTFTAVASDKAGNSQSSSVSAQWDISAPTAPTDLEVTSGEEKLTLDWNGSSDYYVVVRRAQNPVGISLQAGGNYAQGQTLESDHVIAFVGSQSGFVDENLSPFTRYHYAVYGFDHARNISASIAGNALTTELYRFRGIDYAAVVAPNKTIKVDWQPYKDSMVNPSHLIYDLFVATTSGAQNFSGPPAASVTGNSSLYYIHAGSDAKIYLAVRVRNSSVADQNTKEFVLNLAEKSHHKIINNGRVWNSDPLQTFVDQGWAVARDKWGNFVFSGDFGIVQVFCREVSQAPYCVGKSAQRVYTVGGKDGRGPGTNDTPATQTSMGQIVSIAIDADGNIFLGDLTYNMIRALCYSPGTQGLCYGKTPRNHFIIAGIGTAGDGLNNVNATLATMGTPYGLALDAYNNVYIGDASYRRIRIICAQSLGRCAGLTPGNIYRYVGTGALADGANDVVANTSLGLGDIGALYIDANDSIYIADANYRRVRVICGSVGASAGFCAGKSTEKHYRIMGTGVAGNGGDDVAAATAPIGQAYGLVLDALGNIYLTDVTYYRVRVICQSNAGNGFCSDKTVGNVYQYAGTGANANGANATHIMLAGVGTPRGVAIDGNENLVVVDNNFKYLRLLCSMNYVDGLCAESVSGNHYLMVGTGNSGASMEMTLAINNPLGTANGIALDPSGNLYISDATTNRVRVVCYNTAAAGPCYNKIFGFNYYVAGIGSAGDGTDGLGTARAISAPYGLASDSLGNLFIADSGSRRIRVLCNNVSSGGFCNGKIKGYLYRFAGTGSAGDGVDNAAAISTAMGTPFGVAVDSYDNVYVADNSYGRIRLICNSTSGLCAARTIGNTYRLAGTGASGDGNSGAPGATAMGAPTAIAIDRLNNVYVSDALFRVRAICYDVASGSGFCEGKAANQIYRVAGSGATGNAVDGVVADGSPMGTPVALALDSLSNIYIADTTNFFIRSVCFNVSSGGYCQGKISGTMYRLMGDGTNSDGESNIPGHLTQLGNGSYGGMAFTAQGTLLRMDSFNSLRLFFKP